MGEFAGYALDEAMDAENDRWLYRQGMMSDFHAHDLGVIDDRGAYAHVPMFPSSQGKTCKHCGLRGLAWREADDGWRLHKGEEMHVCAEYKK